MTLEGDVADLRRLAGQIGATARGAHATHGVLDPVALALEVHEAFVRTS